MSSDSTWHELAANTAMVMHIEQLTPGSAAVTCNVNGCGEDAVLLITSEPDLDPGFVCRRHGFEWVDFTVKVLRDLFPE